MLDGCDVLLIERQPPGGIKDVEALLASAYRSKVTMISPNSMHKFFKISHLSYDDRKIFTETHAHPYLAGFPDYMALDRKHDVADALCMCLFHAAKTAIRKRPPLTHDLDVFRLY